MQSDLDFLLNEMRYQDAAFSAQRVDDFLAARREQLEDAALHADMQNLEASISATDARWRQYMRNLDRIDGTTHRTQFSQVLDFKVQKASVEGYLGAMKGEKPKHMRGRE